MSEVKLYQRTATGGFHPLPKPQGVPALPKPPYQLADRSGERRFAGTLAGIGENLFDKIIRAQEENEYHSFIGASHEREQQFYNLINQKPDMPLNEMLTERDRMIKDIRLYHSKLKLPRSRQSGANWIASNLGTLKERAEGEIGAVSARYANQTFETYRKYYIANKMPDELANLIEGAVRAGTVREDIGTILLETGYAEINEESAILDIESQARQLAITGGWDAAIKYIIDPKNQQEWANDYGISLETVKKITTDLNTMLNAEQEIAKTELEQKREADRDAISKATASLDPNTLTLIDDSSLDEKEQAEKTQRLRTEVERRASGEDIITNSQVYNALDNEVKAYHLAPSTRAKTDILNRLETERFENKTIAQSEYQKLKDALEAKLSTEDAYWLQEARGLLDESIRERDKLSGMLRTEEGLIAASAMAKMALDKAMDEAAAEGKPIRGRDILIRAMQLVPMFKVPKAEQEKWPSPVTISKGVEEVKVSWSEPATIEEFYETVRKISREQDEDAARAYYEEWVDKW